eukprot:Skav218381  [mRNA]  locus=scaffold2066:321049:321894:- [translate_table: standard]
MKMELPDGLLERIKRLHVQSSVLDKLRDGDGIPPGTRNDVLSNDSRLGAPSPRSPSEEVRRPLEELQQAISAVKAEQGTIRRMQEEELMELCKVRHLLERDGKEKKEKEQEQEILQQIQLQKQAKEQQSIHDVALRVEQMLLSQGSRREEFLQAELRQLDQEEKEVERRNLEKRSELEVLKRQAEMHGVPRTISPSSFTQTQIQQPKIAVEKHRGSIPSYTATASERTASDANRSSTPRDAAIPRTASIQPAELREPLEPVCPNGGTSLLVGKGPLWQYLD